MTNETSIIGGLEADFIDAARDSAKDEISELRPFAVDNTEDTHVYEGGIFRAIVLALGGLLLGVGIPLMEFKEKKTLTGIAIALALVGFFVFFLLWRQWSRRGIPFITMSKDGFFCDDSKECIPWTAVEDYLVRSQSYNGVQMSVSITVDLNDSYTPALPKNGRRTGYNPKKKQVIVTFVGLRGRMNADKFSNLFGSYWRSGCARARLAELGG